MNNKLILCCIIGFTFGLCKQVEAHASPIENGSVEVVQDTWNLSTNIYVGKLTGGNSLVITNGGNLVSEGFGYIGYEASSDNNNVILTGAGSTWTCNGLQLGRLGSNNKLSVLNGAKFYGSTSSYSEIGSLSSSSGNQMLIDGVGSEWTARLIAMNDGPHNELIVSGGAKINGGWSLVLGARSSADYNTVTIEGSGTVIDINRDICMGIDWWDWWDDAFNLRGIGSKLAIKSGALCTAGETVINWNYSTVEIGERAVLSAESYSMDSRSDLIFECSENPTYSGKMNMSGNVALAGDLIVKLETGANVSSGYSVDLMDGNISGTFSRITLPDLPSHLSWDTSLLYSDGIIFIPGVIDLDGDGIADPWEVEKFGSIASCDASADGDGDGHNNYCEYIAGTDPKLKSSCLKVALNITGNDCVINWEPVENRAYSLEWTPNILHTPFATLQGGLVLPQSSATDTNNPSAQGFYRVKVEFIP